jgi:phytoene dehydrogenase-like protein
VNDSVLDSDVLDAAIVGGGIAGLSAAFELQARGLSVRVLEATSRVGGVIATEHVGEWVIDAGPDCPGAKPAGHAVPRAWDCQSARPDPDTGTAYGPRRPAARDLGVVPGLPSLLERWLALFSLASKARMAGEILSPRQRSTRTSRLVRSSAAGSTGSRGISTDPLWPASTPVTSIALVRALFPRLVDAERRSGASSVR